MKIIVIPNMPVMSGRHYCLSRELHRQGHQVTYFMWQLPNDKSVAKLLRHAFTSLIPQTYKYESFTVNKAIRLPFFWPIINGWIFKYQLRKLFKRTGADIVITESYTNETEVPKNLPFIYDLADDYAGPAEVYGSKLYRLAFRLLNVRGIMKRQCQNAVAVTSVSKALNDYASELNPNSILLPNGVDQKLVEKVLGRRMDKVNPHSIVYATGFGPWSRAIETLETVTKLRAEFPDITLTLVGSGSETEKIKQYIKDNQAGGYISYLGYVFDQKKLFTILQNHAIGLNISDKNAWRDASHPMKVMDYSALGMKVVSTNLTEVEALGYDNLFIFSDTDKGNTFINTLRKALKTDKPTQYSDVSKIVLRDYSWKNLTDQLMSLCKSSMNQRQNEAVTNSVVHVTYSYPPILGGLEKVAQQLAQAQSDSGMQVSVLTAKRGLSTSQDYHDSIPVNRLWSFEIANTTIIPSLFWRLLRINKNSVVHLHIAQAFSPEMVWLAAKIKGFRYIAHVHLDVPPSGPAGFLLKIYKPLVLGHVLRAAHAVAVFTNDQVKTFVERYGIDPKKIHAVPNGVSAEFFINKTRKLHKKPRLLFVGRLNYQKNLKQLLYALDGISDKFATTIVGDGELKDELINLASSLKLKNVSFVGSASGGALVEYYKKADIFVLPSEREGMPLVLLEAMAAGLPIVATKVTGNKDVVKHGKNGFLVPYDNANGMRRALIKIISDNQTYRSMSSTSKKHSLAYSWNNVRGLFGNIYTKRPERTSLDATTVSLATAASLLMMLALGSILTNSVYISIFSLIFFSVVPGYLALRRLIGVVNSSFWVTISFSTTLSLLIMMLTGLALNCLHYIGVEEPLRAPWIIGSLSIFTVILILLNRHERVRIPSPSLASKGLLVVISVALTLLPIMSIGGAIRLNNGASNILTMLLFITITLLFLVISSNKKLEPIYPYAIFMFATSLLLSTSLRGWFATGHDIKHELLVFTSVLDKGFWSPSHFPGDPYGACLSITILPTIIAKLSNINDVYVYKIIYQFIFALSAINVFSFVSRLYSKKIAFFSAFIFMSFPAFLSDMPFLNRQEIAFMFFSSLLITAFSDLSYKKKLSVSALMMIGTMLSHYSSTYVMLALLFIAWFIFSVLKIKNQRRRQYKIPLLSLPLLVGILLCTFVWNTQITHTTAGLRTTLTSTVDSITGKRKADREGFVKYSLLAPRPMSPEQRFVQFIGQDNQGAVYKAPASLNATPLGSNLAKLFDINKFNAYLHTYTAKFLQVLVLLGVVVLVFRMRKELNGDKFYYSILSISAVGLLGIISVLPQLSVDYSVIRMFQQLLIVLALPMVIAILSITRLIRRYNYTIASFVVVSIFAILSGFIPQSIGGAMPQLSLNNRGAYYDFFYTHNSDIKASEWLAGNRDETKKVFIDTNSALPGLNFPIYTGLLNKPGQIPNSTGYLYSDNLNTTKGVYRVFISGDLVEYTDESVKYGRSLVYSNSESEIYAPK